MKSEAALNEGGRLNKNIVMQEQLLSFFGGLCEQTHCLVVVLVCCVCERVDCRRVKEYHGMLSANSSSCRSETAPAPFPLDAPAPIKEKSRMEYGFLAFRFSI